MHLYNSDVMIVDYTYEYKTNPFRSRRGVN